MHGEKEVKFLKTVAILLLKITFYVSGLLTRAYATHDFTSGLSESRELRGKHMSRSSGNFAKLPSTVLKTDSECIYGDTSATKSSCWDNYIIVRDTVCHDNQHFLPSGLGVRFEQVPSSSSYS